jgi:hypothetical protein
MDNNNKLVDDLTTETQAQLVYESLLKQLAKVLQNQVSGGFMSFVLSY